MDLARTSAGEGLSVGFGVYGMEGLLPGGIRVLLWVYGFVESRLASRVRRVWRINQGVTV